MSDPKDLQLELLMEKIKTSTSTHNKLSSYKKAQDRINELKTEYNKLCSVLQTKKKKSPDKIPIHIHTSIEELSKINSLIDSNTDLIETIDNYIQYKLILENLETSVELAKNKIYKVEQLKNKIRIEKLDTIV